MMFAKCPASTWFEIFKNAPLPCSSTMCTVLQGQPCPSQDPYDSTTPLPSCAFTKPFADASFDASLASDWLHLGKDAIPNYAFGCVGSVRDRKSVV